MTSHRCFIVDMTGEHDDPWQHVSFKEDVCTILAVGGFSVVVVVGFFGRFVFNVFLF